MNDRYLWEKRGKPDPETRRLERLVGRYAHQGEPLELPGGERVGGLEAVPRTEPASWAWVLRGLATAAALAIVAGAGWWWASGRGWEIASLAGEPRLGEKALGASGRARAGDLLVTDARSSARIEVGRIGIVEVGPGSRLRILGRKGREHRLALDRGVLDAIVLAPPRQFFVETPAATAVDLGCAYSLEVDAAGGALLTVVAGWVSFEHQGRESFIPAGARCATRPGRGPGTPYFTDATSGFKNALAEMDLAAPGAGPSEALAVALAEARREDAFTLWHLLARVQQGDRVRVFERLSVLAPPPPGVTRAGVLSGERAMLDLWWDSLGLGQTKDWRRWKGPMPASG